MSATALASFKGVADICVDEQLPRSARQFDKTFMSDHYSGIAQEPESTASPEPFAGSTESTFSLWRWFLKHQVDGRCHQDIVVLDSTGPRLAPIWRA